MSVDSKGTQAAASVSDDIKQLSEEDLCRIKDFQIGELPKNSGYVHPFRARFVDERNNNPVQRQWDAIDAHVRCMLDTSPSVPITLTPSYCS